MKPDIQTLILLNLIINFVNAFVMIILWRQYRKHFAGLVFLVADMFMQIAGFFLSLLRGILPAFISIVLSNVFLLFGALLILIGLEYFFDKKSKHLHNYIFLSVFMGVLVYFGMIRPNLTARDICISVLIVLINAQTCWLLFRRVAPVFRKIARLTGVTLFAYIVVSFVRIVLLVVFPVQTNDYFQSGLIDSVSITVYLVLSVLVTMSMFLMVSQRLLGEVQIEKDKYITTFNSSPYAIILTRLTDGKIFEINEGFTKLTGYQSEEILGKKTLEINLWNQENDRTFIVSELSKGNEVRDLELNFRSKSGRLVIGLLSSSLIDVNNEKCILTCVSDITEMVTMRQKLETLVLHDVLTGLPNRKYFYDYFERTKTKAQRENGKFAIVSMDIDLLKLVNDVFGHHAGDQVLIAIGTRLFESLRKNDIVARFGGDEFVMLVAEIDQLKDVIAIVEKILKIVSQPIKIESNMINVTMSMGIAIYAEDGMDIESLLKISDQAMYLAKEQGRNNYHYIQK